MSTIIGLVSTFRLPLHHFSRSPKVLARHERLDFEVMQSQ